MTVRGSIPAAELGKTLTHEDVLVDFIGAEGSVCNQWNREEVILVLLQRLMAVENLADESLCGVCPAFLGKDLRLLQRLSELSELNQIEKGIILGPREPVHPSENPRLADQR